MYSLGLAFLKKLHYFLRENFIHEHCIYIIPIFPLSQLLSYPQIHELMFIIIVICTNIHKCTYVCVHICIFNLLSPLSIVNTARCSGLTTSSSLSIHWPPIALHLELGTCVIFFVHCQLVLYSDF